MTMLQCTLARPNLGQPAIINPDQLSRFTITVAGFDWPSGTARSADVALAFVRAQKLKLQFTAKTGNTAQVDVDFLGAQGALKFYAAPTTKYASKIRPNSKSGEGDGYSENSEFPITSEEHRYRLGFRWELDLAVGLNADAKARLLALAALPLRIDLRLGSASNQHALFVTQKSIAAENWNVWQVSDIHIAHRNDKILEVLQQTRSKVEQLNLRQRYINFNQNFRDLIAQANAAYRKGELDFLVITGDLVDSHIDRHMKDAGGEAHNYALLRDMLIGNDKRGEALECPVFTVLGNHDYRYDEPPLLLNAYVSKLKAASAAAGATPAVGAADILVSALTGGLLPPGVISGSYAALAPFAAALLVGVYANMPRRDHGSFGLTLAEAGEYEQWVKGANVQKRSEYKRKYTGHDDKVPLPDVDAVDAYKLLMPQYKHLDFYLREFSFDCDFVVRAGPHRLVCINTGYDRLPAPREMITAHFTDDKSKLTAWERDADAGSVHSRGVTDEHLQLLQQAKREAGAHGVVSVFGHAPLFTPARNHTKYFSYLYRQRHLRPDPVPNDVTWVLQQMENKKQLRPSELRKRLNNPSKDDLDQWEDVTTDAQRYLGRGFPQQGSEYFYRGVYSGSEATDFPLMTYGAADYCERQNASVGTLRRAFLNTLCGNESPQAARVRNPVAGFFAGHTHLVHEFLFTSVPGASAAAPATLTLTADQFSGGGGEALNEILHDEHQIDAAASPRPANLGHHALAVTSGGTKAKLVNYRRLALKPERLDDFSMQWHHRGGPLHGAEYLHAHLSTYLTQRFGAYLPENFRVTDPYLLLAYTRLRGRTEVMLNLEERLLWPLQFPSPTFGYTRQLLAQVYADLALRLNALGAATGNSARDSMDHNVHFIWALSADTPDTGLMNEISARLDVLDEFISAPGNTHHLLCCWFCEESVELARLGGFNHPARDSVNPAVHLNWARHENMFSIMQDLEQKYRIQFDRLKPAAHGDVKPFLDFCATSMVRSLSWGAESTRDIRPSLDTDDYRNQALTMHNLGQHDALWQQIKFHLQRVNAALTCAAL